MEFWTLKLTLQLIGKVQQAHAAINNSDATDNKKDKEAILQYYDISEEMYWQSF